MFFAIYITVGVLTVLLCTELDHRDRLPSSLKVAGSAAFLSALMWLWLWPLVLLGLLTSKV